MVPFTSNVWIVYIMVVYPSVYIYTYFTVSCIVWWKLQYIRHWGVSPVVIHTETTTGGEKGAREADEGTCAGWRNDPRRDQHANNSQEQNVHRFKTKKCIFCEHETNRLFAMKLLMDETRQAIWYGICLINSTALTHSNWCRSVSSNYTFHLQGKKPGFVPDKHKYWFDQVNEVAGYLQQLLEIFSQTPFFYVVKCGMGSSPPCFLMTFIPKFHGFNGSNGLPHA